MIRFLSSLAILCSGVFQFSLPAADTPPLPSGPQRDGAFRKVILDADRDSDGDGKVDNTLNDPMELAIAPDGRVFFVERSGAVKVWQPSTAASKEIGRLDVFTTGGKKNLEDGLLGIALDPGFSKTGWIYLFYSPPAESENRVSRFTVRDDALDLASEKILLRIATQRDQCCHAGGSLAFDRDGNLYASTGDNTNPFDSDGFAPVDERPGRSPWDAQKSSSNPNDLRGKILRIKPNPDGTCSIPKGNLFPPGTEGTRPEIFVMGCRNPYRVSLDAKTGYLYWGDVGPDAAAVKEGRGPAGYDEVNQARAPGFFGWPYFIGENRAYHRFDYETRTPGEAFDATKPVNASPNNTGREELPPAQPAFIAYASFPSAKFPALNAGGGRTAMAGPVYYFDSKLDSPHKLPAEFDHTLFIYEWSRNWIVAAQLNAQENVGKLARFCPNLTFKRPMDMELGPDGCLYVIEWGTGWGNNLDTQIVRIEHAPGPSAVGN